MYIRLFHVIIVLSMLAGSISGAGNTTTDSLKQVFKRATHDTTRCRILFLMTEAESDDKIWPVYNDSLKALAERNLQTTPPKAPLYVVYKKYLADALNNIGYLASHRGNVTIAIENLQKSLDIYEELGLQYEQANSFNNIAFVYMSQKEYDKALEFFRKSYTFFNAGKNEQMIAVTLNNLGICFGNMGLIDSALVYYNRSLVIREKLGNKRTMATCLNNIGNLYKTRGQYAEALATLEKALAYAESDSDKENSSVCLNNIGSIYLALKQPAKALQYSERSLVLAKEIGYPIQISRTASVLKEIYRELKNYEKAFEMSELHKLMSDSINKSEFRQAAIRNQFQYDYNKRIIEDSLERATEKTIEAERFAASEARVQQAKTQRLALYGGLFLVLVFAFFIFNRFRMTRKQNVIIREQKALVEAKNKNILDSINYARHIQEAILPADSYFKSLLPDSFVIYQPKDIVSGDFYFVGSPANNQGDQLVVVSVGDCTGHGVPGAFLTLLGKTFLQLGLEESTVNSCADALNFLNKGLSGMLNKAAKGELAVRDGMDISLCSIHSRTLRMEFAGAKNPVCIVRKNELIELKADKHAIGEMDAANQTIPFTNQVFQLEKGDCVYIFTDGFADQFGGPAAAAGGKKFKYKPLTRLLVSLYDKPMPEQQQLLIAAFEDWKGSLEQVDDVCMIGIRI